MSYDFLEDDQDPSSNDPSHGTSVGGIIASLKDGQTCGVGIAYNGNLGGKQEILYIILQNGIHDFVTGIALLGANTDMNELMSLTYENDITDIYSNSWGPSDDGDIVAGPGQLAKMALQDGVMEVI